MSAPMTTGIAYGAKISSRERLDRRVASVSSTSAAASATMQLRRDHDDRERRDAAGAPRGRAGR